MSSLPRGLRPIFGPRNTVGRLIAGDTVPQDEADADTSDFVRVFVEPHIVPALPADEAIGFIAQCSICPQRAVLHTQPAGEWTCPRCALVVPPLDEDLAVAVSDMVLAPREPARNDGIVYTDQIAAVRVESGHDIGRNTALEYAAAFFPQHQRAGFGDVDIDQAEPDDWPLGQVQG